MRITYDPVARAAYIYISDNGIRGTRSITDQVIIDLDVDARVVGVELLFVDEPIVELLGAAGTTAAGWGCGGGA